MTSVQERKIRQTGCEARFDNLTRQLYATDASIYQIEPVGVAFPKSAQQANAVIRAAADAALSITPRGAGTSLVGNAIGEGLIVEFSRYNRPITDLDFEKRSVRVGSGVVLDQLNDFLRTHGFCFGPDVATSARATLGGMIANNSSGARVPVYGTTADHVLSLEIVMADGRIETIGTEHHTLGAERNKIEHLDLKPAAIEHIDRLLLDQTRGQLHFQAARDLLELHAKPCESILIVEFYDDVAERLSILQSRKIGLRTKILTDSAQMNLVWSVRKSGLSLLTGCIGPAKPVAFIEDAAVRPAQLPEYVRGLQSIMNPL